MDAGARDDLILENTGWARQIAMQTIRAHRLLVQPDDAISAAFLALVESAGRYKRGVGVADFRPFAAHRVRGAVLDLVRRENSHGRTAEGRRRFRAAALDISELLGRLADPGPGPLDLAIAMQAIRLFAHARPLEHQVLWLYHVEGLPLKAIGQQLGLTESRICQIQQEGSARIREAIRSVT